MIDAKERWLEKKENNMKIGRRDNYVFEELWEVFSQPQNREKKLETYIG